MLNLRTALRKTKNIKFRVYTTADFFVEVVLVMLCVPILLNTTMVIVNVKIRVAIKFIRKR